MRLPQTIRLDASDAHVFDSAAEPGEWAVTGTFAFVDADPATMSGRERQAFRSGWLGTTSFGWATLVRVREAADTDAEQAAAKLAAHLMDLYGAPDREAAAGAARAEVADAAAAASDHPVGTLLAIQREASTDGITERIVVVRPPADGMAAPIRVWTLDEEG